MKKQSKNARLFPLINRTFAVIVVPIPQKGFKLSGYILLAIKTP